jgi:hypothetical protein
MNDLSGQVIPFDLLYQGEESFVFLDLTRWNEDIRVSVAGRIAPGGNPRAGAGTAVLGDYGTMTITEGAAMELWLLFPYSPLGGPAAKAAMGALGPGYHFLASIPIGPDDHHTLGTNPYKVLMAFHNLRKFNPSTGTFTSWDTDFSAIPGNLGIN